MIILKLILSALLLVDALGSYRTLDDQWTAIELFFLWAFIVAKLTASVAIWT